MFHYSNATFEVRALIHSFAPAYVPLTLGHTHNQTQIQPTPCSWFVCLAVIKRHTNISRHR